MPPIDEAKAYQLFFKRLMESLPDHVYFKDREGRFLCVNQAQAAYLGLKSPADAVGKTDLDFFERTQAKQKGADEIEIIQTGIGFVDKEERASTVDGVERWVVTTKLPLFGDGGEIIGTFGISRNISEMKAAREALDRHHRLLSTLIEILPCRIFVKDTAGRIMLTNRAYRGALGISDETDILGKRLGELVLDMRSHRYADDDNKVMNQGVSIINREDYDASPIGDKRWLLLSKVPLRDAEGTIEGMVGMAADITPQKEAEARAIEAQKALEEQNRQIEAELELARELQTELMASSIQGVRDELDPHAPFLPRVGFHYAPSAHLAGDFFQFIPISEHEFAFIMCDVMGHGVKAALVTTLLRGLVANLRADELRPSEALSQLNERLCTLLDRPPLPRFVTAVYAHFDVRTGGFRFASAGHPWPLRQQKKEIAPMSTNQCGPALGLIRGAVYEDLECTFARGDRLLLYTDGWVEQASADGEEFGEQRLSAAIAECSDENPYAVLDHLVSSLREHSGHSQNNDDLCAILACF